MGSAFTVAEDTPMRRSRKGRSMVPSKKKKTKENITSLINFKIKGCEHLQFQIVALLEEKVNDLQDDEEDEEPRRVNV